MSLDEIKDKVPDWAKDLRINLGNVLSEEGSPGLNKTQIFGSSLACAFAEKNKFLSENIKKEAGESLTEEELFGIKASVALMGMNNVYYRGLHLAENSDLSKLPARLRMTMMKSHGISQKNFEIYSLAISLLSGCGMCIKSHTEVLKKEGLSLEGIQSVFRISSLIKALSQTLNLDSIA